MVVSHQRSDKNGQLVAYENLFWAAYHVSSSSNQHYTKSMSYVSLAIAYEDSKSVAMLCHEMKIVKNAVNYLNPGQIPIVTADQPLYTLCKQKFSGGVLICKVKNITL